MLMENPGQQEGREGQAQGHPQHGGSDLSHCSEVTPGKKIPTKLSTAPRPCSATQPVSSGLLPSFFTFPVASPRSFFHLLHTLCSTTSLDLQVFGESSPQDLCSFPEPRWELPLPRVSVARGGALMPRFSHIIRHNFLMILLNQLPNKAGGIPRLLRSYVSGTAAGIGCFESMLLG